MKSGVYWLKFKEPNKESKVVRLCYIKDFYLKDGIMYYEIGNDNYFVIPTSWIINYIEVKNPFSYDDGSVDISDIATRKFF
jgi:hypothetical protein